MTVGLKVSGIVIEIGPSSILTALFSTIHFNLEDGEWGGVYPVLLKELYEGTLSAESGKAALLEFNEVDDKFKEIPPDKAVWDVKDLEMPRPNEFPFARDAKNLSEYFVTKSGKLLLPIIESRLQLMVKHNKKMTIDSGFFKFLPPKQH